MRGRTWGCRSVVVLLLLVLPAVAATSVPALAASSALSPNVHASVDNSSLSWDQTTTLHGTGWAPGKTIQIILYAGGITLGSPVAAADGSITATIRAPHVGSGNQYKLAVQGFAGDGNYGYVAVPLTITGPTPAVSIGATQLHWGSTTTVSGVRYKPGAAISVSLFPDNTTLGHTTAGADDTFSVPITIPSNLRSATNYQLAITGQGIDLIFHFDVIQITIIGNRPSISISTTNAPRGSSLQVSGQLFLKGTNALVTLLPGYEKLGSFPVAPDGSFTGNVQIPPKAGGTDPHAILVTGTGTDGLFAYVQARLNLGGSPPAGTTTANAIGIDQNSPTPPGFVPDAFGVTPGSISGGTHATGQGGISPNLLVVVLILLVTAAIIVVFALTARRDVQRRSDHLLRRLHLRR
jgi:hypothetical protein